MQRTTAIGIVLLENAIFNCGIAINKRAAGVNIAAILNRKTVQCACVV